MDGKRADFPEFLNWSCSFGVRTEVITADAAIGAHMRGDLTSSMSEEKRTVGGRVGAKKDSKNLTLPLASVLLVPCESPLDLPVFWSVSLAATRRASQAGRGEFEPT